MGTDDTLLCECCDYQFAVCIHNWLNCTAVFPKPEFDCVYRVILNCPIRFASSQRREGINNSNCLCFQVSSYGSEFNYTVNYNDGPNATLLTGIADLQLTGNGVTLFYSNELGSLPGGDLIMVVQLKEVSFCFQLFLYS